MFLITCDFCDTKFKVGQHVFDKNSVTFVCPKCNKKNRFVKSVSQDNKKTSNFNSGKSFGQLKYQTRCPKCETYYSLDYNKIHKFSHLVCFKCKYRYQLVFSDKKEEEGKIEPALAASSPEQSNSIIKSDDSNGISPAEDQQSNNKIPDPVISSDNTEDQQSNIQIPEPDISPEDTNDIHSSSLTLSEKQLSNINPEEIIISDDNPEIQTERDTQVVEKAENTLNFSDKKNIIREINELNFDSGAIASKIPENKNPEEEASIKTDQKSDSVGLITKDDINNNKKENSTEDIEQTYLSMIRLDSSDGTFPNFSFQQSAETVLSSVPSERRYKFFLKPTKVEEKFYFNKVKEAIKGDISSSFDKSLDENENLDEISSIKAGKNKSKLLSEYDVNFHKENVSTYYIHQKKKRIILFSVLFILLLTLLLLNLFFV